MARLLAFDWDRLEARMILARVQAGQIQIDQIVAEPLDLDAQESSLAGLRDELARALEKHRIPRCGVLTAIGRSLVELRTLKLPPAPEEELPEIVRFQAMREFSTLRENSPLDFIPMGAAGSQAGEVMAVAISADLARELADAFSRTGHESKRAALRPCAAASLALRRCQQARQGVTLIIAPLADAAELTIAKDGHVVFTRSFRLPPDWHPGESGEPLLGEVRRTIAAAQNQLEGSRVEHVVLLGTAGEHGGLRARLEERTKLDVELLDPLKGFTIASTLPAQPERFASLVGMLEDEAADAKPAIDFLNPRRKPVPESNRRLYVLLGATAAVVLLMIVGAIYWRFHGLNQQVARLAQQHRELDLENKRLQPTVELAEKLDRWKASDHNWLEELRHFSTIDTLTAEDFRLESFRAFARERQPGIIEIHGRAKDFQAKAVMQNEVADESHDVEPGRSATGGQDPRYPEEFTATVRASAWIPIVPAATEKPEATSDAEKSTSDGDDDQAPPTEDGQAAPTEDDQAAPMDDDVVGAGEERLLSSSTAR